MKNRKKLVITLIGVIVLGIGLFVYQTFIKKQLHFKENMAVEINGKFNPIAILVKLNMEVLKM